jgi:transcriptional regulator with XRE-family HTH domain
MDIRSWRSQRELTLADCAGRLGLDSSRTYHRYETGENRADADMVERIALMTDGSVAAEDMHQTRLAWLREHRPERFASSGPSSQVVSGTRPDVASLGMSGRDTIHEAVK